MRGDPEAWRSWSRNAAPELRQLFDKRSAECLSAVRRRFPPDCSPTNDKGDYHRLKHECRLALSELAADIEEEHHA